MTAIASSTFALQSAPSERAAARANAHEEFQRMSDAMVEEKGLLNHAQAALLLDVSTKRVGELVRLGKLTDFPFLGRKYVSMREIWERNKQSLKAGRPRRGKAKEFVDTLKAAVKTDKIQARLGGYAGPYHKRREQERKKKQREERKEFWKTVREIHKK